MIRFENLPLFRQDNEFILQGYRPEYRSFFLCIQSILRIHTETGNIWTHLLGCAIFLCRTVYFLCQPYSLQEKFFLSMFLLGAVTCMGLSFAYHTFACHSREVTFVFSRLDYCGIAMLIMGSIVPWIQYAFYCNKLVRALYFTAIILMFSLCICVSLYTKFSHPEFRSRRASVFLFFGLSSILPLIHFLYMKGWKIAVREAAVNWLLLMGFLYVVGTLLYVFRVPERFYPGRCDIWFQSHQIFHILVITAAFVHFHGLSEMAIYRITVGECAP